MRKRRSFDAATSAIATATATATATARKDKSPALMMIGERRPPLFRRASVWNESPPAVLRSPFDRLTVAAQSNAWLLLLASWGSGQRSRHGSDASTASSSTALTTSATRTLPRMPRAATIVEEEEDAMAIVDYGLYSLLLSTLLCSTQASLR